MVNLARVVSATSFEVSAPATTIPTPLLIIYDAIHRVHRMWRWYRKATIYSNPNNFVSLACGHTLNYLAGDRLLVRISALSVLIANRIMMVVDQIFRLQESIRKLQNSCRDEYSEVTKYEIVTGSFFSPSTLSEAKYTLRNTLEKIRRIFFCVLHVLKDTFLLSMRMIDAIEMFYLSPQSREEGINEIFVNGSEMLSTLEENQANLLNSLKKCKGIIDKVLKGIGSEYTADQFIQAASTTLDTVADAHQMTQAITNPFVIVVKELGKRILMGYASWFCVDSLIPKYLHPTYTIPPREMDPVFHFIPASSIKIYT
jgi:hypothetical protein